MGLKGGKGVEKKSSYPSRLAKDLSPDSLFTPLANVRIADFSATQNLAILVSGVQPNLHFKVRSC